MFKHKQYITIDLATSNSAKLGFARGEKTSSSAIFYSEGDIPRLALSQTEINIVNITHEGRRSMILKGVMVINGNSREVAVKFSSPDTLQRERWVSRATRRQCGATPLWCLFVR